MDTISRRLSDNLLNFAESDWIAEKSSQGKKTVVVDVLDLCRYCYYGRRVCLVSEHMGELREKQSQRRLYAQLALARSKGILVQDRRESTAAHSQSSETISRSFMDAYSSPFTDTIGVQPSLNASNGQREGSGDDGTLEQGNECTGLYESEIDHLNAEACFGSRYLVQIQLRWPQLILSRARMIPSI